MTTLVRPDGSAIANKLKESKPDIPTKPKDISKMLEKVPEPTGWRILVRPYMPPAKTKGGVFVSDESQERIAVATVCALVLKMGPLCYRDENKFPTGAWCKEGQWVIFGRYAGSRFRTDLGRSENS
jgi:co-chaperonin GroES (HSP10)